VLGDRSALSYFDRRHELMASGNAAEGVRSLCYERQADVLEGLFQPGMLVLDAGCGPALPYRRPGDLRVIGVDASYEAIVANRDVDLRIYGSALNVPLPDASVDLVVAYYAIHHITGETVAENMSNLRRALGELGRVVKPGGSLAVFEVSPWWPVWQIERIAWNQARRLLGCKLDMYFSPASVYASVGRAMLPKAYFTCQTFRSSPYSTFPPVFSFPALRIPRALYPFTINLYRWQFPE
jgi:SAM-dependent methyltransferase